MLGDYKANTSFSYQGNIPHSQGYPLSLSRLQIEPFHQGNNQNMQNINSLAAQLIKDVQVYQDNTEYSQMIPQMVIPVSADGSYILVQEWIQILELECQMPLSQAKYVNIWDPISKNYFNIAKLAQYSAASVIVSSPIYIRYAPNSEFIQQQLIKNQQAYISSGSSPAPSIFQALGKGNKHQQQQYYQPKQQEENEEYTEVFPMIKNENFSPKHNEMDLKSVNRSDLRYFHGTIKMEEGNNLINGAITGMPQTPKTEAEDSSEENLETFKLKGLKKKNSDKFKLSSEKSPSKKHIPREKRVKERQISYVKGKVDEWRSLYENGKTSFIGQNEKVNLDIAAQIVGLSRKTLDDYYAQIRKAQRYGFDFELNGSEKMGSLRKFVKKMSNNNKDNFDEDSSENIECQKTVMFHTPQLKPAVTTTIASQSSEDQDQEILERKKVFRKFSENKYDLLRLISTSSSTSTATTTPSPVGFVVPQNTNNKINNNPSSSQIFTLTPPLSQQFIKIPAQQETKLSVSLNNMIQPNNNSCMKLNSECYQISQNVDQSLFISEIQSNPNNNDNLGFAIEANNLPIFNAINGGNGFIKQKQPETSSNFVLDGETMEMEVDESFDYLQSDKNPEDNLQQEGTYITEKIYQNDHNTVNFNSRFG